LIGGFQLLLVGGYGKSTTMKDVEVIDMGSSLSTCKKLPDFPYPFVSAISGQSFQNNTLICGGYTGGSDYSNTCYELVSGTWKPFFNMSSLRGLSGFAQNTFSNSPKLAIFGTDASSSKTSEYLLEDGWHAIAQTFSYKFRLACAVFINPMTAFIISGGRDAVPTTATLFYNFATKSFSTGPSVKYARWGPLCGRVLKGFNSLEYAVIIAGSEAVSTAKTTEVYNMEANTWNDGPGLPFEVRKSVAVEDPFGGLVISGGLTPTNAFELRILRLKNLESKWEIVPQKLVTGRHSHALFAIPENYFNCSMK